MKIESNQTFFTVVVTTYNQADKVERCLDSVLGQTFTNFEIIVVDDGSKDATYDILKNYQSDPRITLHRQVNFGGPARGRNFGISHAKGNWIAFLDGDDWWYPNKLEVVAQHCTGLDVIYHELDYYDKNGKMPRTTNGRLIKTPFFEDLLINGNCLSNSATCVRTAMLKRVGLLSEEKLLVAVEDYDLWLRLSQISERFLYLPDTLGAYWFDTGTLSSPSAGYITKTLAVVKPYLAFLDNSKQVDAQLRAKYIAARYKLRLKDSGACQDFWDIFCTSGRLNLKLRGLLFFVISFFSLKLGNREQ